METLQAHFNLYARAFFLNAKFLQDGLVLLPRVIDLNTSTRERLVFHQDFLISPYHIRENCQNLVYLKVWDQGQGSRFNEEGLTVSPFTKMYTGQTDDFRVRERSRQEYVTAMGVPVFNICFSHSLDNEYHRAALEVALMAYNFLIFGLSQINRSPYGNNWYTNVQLDIQVDNINASHYSRRLGWTAWRYALLVGTAPPQRIALDPTYHDFLNGSRSLNPLMDFTRFPLRQGGGLDMFLRLLGMNDQPGFIDHYPHNICDRMHDWSPNLSNQHIETADHHFARHCKLMALTLL